MTSQQIIDTLHELREELAVALKAPHPRSSEEKAKARRFFAVHQAIGKIAQYHRVNTTIPHLNAEVASYERLWTKRLGRPTYANSPALRMPGSRGSERKLAEETSREAVG